MENQEKKQKWRIALPVCLVAAVVLCAFLAAIPFEAEENGAASTSSHREESLPVSSALQDGEEERSFEESSQEKASPEETPEPTPTPTPTPTPVTMENYWLDFQQSEDPLLVLVNEHIPLPEDYDPDLTGYDGVQINGLMYDALYQMLADAREEGMDLWVASGYRDYGMTQEEARENALRSFALPGHSEHHTGLAVDFNGVNREFEDTEEYAWLMENAWRYGFIQRYPEEKTEITGIIFEPWHYRYVGREHAEAMWREDLCLEEYLVDLVNRQREGGQAQ